MIKIFLKNYKIVIFLLIFLSFISKSVFSYELNARQKKVLNELENLSRDFNDMKELYPDFWDIVYPLVFERNCMVKEVLDYESSYGNILATQIIAELKIEGLCYEVNISAAVKTMEFLAREHNLAPSQLYLSKIYKDGFVYLADDKKINIGKKDIKLYIFYTELAKNNNVKEAKFNYAIELIKGEHILQNYKEAFNILMDVARSDNIRYSKLAYLELIRQFYIFHGDKLKRYINSLLDPNVNKSMDYSFLDTAYFFAEECSNIGFSECIVFMPSLVESYKGSEKYNDELLSEAYAWLILGKIFTTNEKIKKISEKNFNNLKNNNDITIEIELRGQEIAENWFPDGLLRFIE